MATEYTEDLNVKYCSIPVVVDAWQWVDLPGGGAEEPPQWVESALLEWARPGSLTLFANGDPDAPLPWRDQRHIAVQTPVGVMRAERDDWIIRTKDGELHSPMKPDAFAQTYRRL